MLELSAAMIGGSSGRGRSGSDPCSSAVDSESSPPLRLGATSELDPVAKGCH